MKKLTMIVLAALVLVTAATPVLALGPLDVEAGLAMNAKYVWRGMVVTPDPVLQPSVDVSVLGFSAGFWGNMDTNDVNEQEMKFNEVDWTLGYGVSLPVLDISGGFINYTFPGSDVASTTEFYLGAAASVLFSPSLTVYLDIDEVKGGYWELGASHAVPLNPGMELELSAGVGMGSESYIFGYYGLLPDNISMDPDLAVPVDASMTDYYISAAIPFHPAPMFTVTPSVGYTSLSGDVKDIVDGVDSGYYHGESDAFVWGLSAAFSF